MKIYRLTVQWSDGKVLHVMCVCLVWMRVAFLSFFPSLSILPSSHSCSDYFLSFFLSFSVSFFLLCFLPNDQPTNQIKTQSARFVHKQTAYTVITNKKTRQNQQQQQQKTRQLVIGFQRPVSHTWLLEGDHRPM